MEVQHLKRQVAQLTQLLSEGSTGSTRIARQESSLMHDARQRADRVTEQFAALDNEHALSSKAALSEQRKRYEMQLAELREENKLMSETQSESDRQLASLQQEVEDLVEQLVGRPATEFGEAQEARASQSTPRVRGAAPEGIRGAAAASSTSVPGASPEEAASSKGALTSRIAEVRRTLSLVRAEQEKLLAGEGLATTATALKHHLAKAQAPVFDKVRATSLLVVRERVDRCRQRAFEAWAGATATAYREALHRRRVIEVQAESAAECFAIRTEGKKEAIKLRKQRRFHGVSSIHANLAFQMHAVFTSWAHFVTENQWETAHQRQLDFAAAEAASDSVALRAECQCRVSELRRQQYVLVLTGIRAHGDHWRHVVMYAWAALAVASRRAGAAEAVEANRSPSPLELGSGEASAAPTGVAAAEAAEAPDMEGASQAQPMEEAT